MHRTQLRFRDGWGAVEWYGFADSNYVHHNFASENKGFMEIGGGSANDTVVAYNVSIDNGRFSIFHLDNQFQSEVRNFRLENNTIIETGNEAPGWVVFVLQAYPTRRHSSYVIIFFI